MLVLLVSACEKKEAYISPIVSEIFTETCEAANTSDPIQVSASRAIETVNILFFLASHENWPYIRLTNTVHHDIQKTFQRFRNHKARNLTAKLANDTGGWMYPGTMASFIEYDGHFKWKTEPPPFLYEYAQKIGETFADDYLKALNKFYVDANVEKFLEKHATTYRASVRSAQTNTLTTEGLKLQQAYYGASADAHCLFISLAQYSFAFSVNEPFGRDNLALFVIGPFSEVSIRDNQNGFQNPVTLTSVTLHELGHSFLGEFPNKPIQETSYLLERSKKKNNSTHPYSTWESALEEHIVRAAEIRIWEALGEPETAEEIRRKNLDFPYLAITEELLIDYENARDEYPTLTSYLPTLIEGLTEKGQKFETRKLNTR